MGVEESRRKGEIMSAIYWVLLALLAAVGLGIGAAIHLRRKHAMEKQAEIQKQAEMGKQAEMRKQAEIRRQAEMLEQPLRSSAPHSPSLASGHTLSRSGAPDP